MLKKSFYLILFVTFIQSSIFCMAGGMSKDSLYFLIKRDDVQVLIDAAGKGDKDKVLKLINKGVDVNSTDKYGYTALMTACFYGNPEMVQLLIDSNAYINMKTCEGTTELLLAIQFLVSTRKPQMKIIIRQLIDAGANINAKDVCGENPLMLASIAGEKDVVEFLIKKGADVKATNNNGQSALSLAKKLKHQEIIELLSKYQS
ncbi:ankyrin repeat domain-containing protein [Candidatus Dependentiae bacterium]|nr:ankyrin repeat domain-containing protein [Candidatus Dependentiae bacterium]